MAVEIGKVSALIGEAQARSDSGDSRFLQQGDSVYEHDTLTTGSFGGIEIELTDGGQMAIGHTMTLSLDPASLLLNDAAAQPVEDDLNFDHLAELNASYAPVLESMHSLDISDVLVGTGVNADNLHDYLKATYDPQHNTTQIDIFTAGDALDSKAVASERLFINGDASHLTPLLENGQLVIDPS